MSEFLGSHIFTPDDLIRFAELSGDWNPIHVDRLTAHRLLAGEQVVHGMLALLWALDRHFAKSADIPAEITAFFQRPLLIGEQVTVHRAAVESDVERLSLQHHGAEAASIVLRGTGKRTSEPVPNHNPSRTQPKPFTFAELRGVSGTVEVSAALDALTCVFPHTCNALGIMPVAAIMALSRIVGMECPGLHSLYTGLDLTLGLSETQPQLHWRVVRHTVPLAPVRIEARGGGIAARMDAFVRPTPVEQPSMREIARDLGPKDYAAQRAVIIGGSRGLGELVAKIIAAGGGQVVITYRSGAEDARRVTQEITSWGGKCHVIQADMSDPIALIPALDSPTHLYYFATPHISPQKNPLLDEALYQTYHRIYVHAFEQLISTLAASLPHKLNVFYPSTVLVDEKPKHFAEYIKAKEEGERLCALLNQRFANLRCRIIRLPRMSTDQTASLLPRPLKSSLQEMERMVNTMASDSK